MQSLEHSNKDNKGRCSPSEKPVQRVRKNSSFSPRCEPRSFAPRTSGHLRDANRERLYRSGALRRTLFPTNQCCSTAGGRRMRPMCRAVWSIGHSFHSFRARVEGTEPRAAQSSTAQNRPVSSCHIMSLPITARGAQGFLLEVCKTVQRTVDRKASSWSHQEPIYTALASRSLNWFIDFVAARICLCCVQVKESLLLQEQANSQHVLGKHNSKAALSCEATCNMQGYLLQKCQCSVGQAIGLCISCSGLDLPTRCRQS